VTHFCGDAKAAVKSTRRGRRRLAANIEGAFRVNRDGIHARRIFQKQPGVDVGRKHVARNADSNGPVVVGQGLFEIAN